MAFGNQRYRGQMRLRLTPNVVFAAYNATSSEPVDDASGVNRLEAGIQKRLSHRHLRAGPNGSHKPDLVTMTQAIRIHRHGGPEVLELESVEVGAPAPNEMLIRQKAIGVNFIDVYHRTGLYPLALPLIPGVEGAGIVESVGGDVRGFNVGDRVAYAGGPVGAYSEVRVLPADRALALPPDVSYEIAAGGLLRGMTAFVLTNRVYVLKPGDAVLIHAAAGGMGILLCRWAASLGATVIGTVSTSAKAEKARENGCHHPIVASEEDFVERVRELTNGEGLPVVYDSIGKDTFLRSLDCLRPRGLMVTYGQSSGPVPLLDTGLLARKGSLFLTRPSLFTYIAKREDLLTAAGTLFEAIRKSRVRIDVGQRFPLARAADAHRALEERRTTGSSILLPA